MSVKSDFHSVLRSFSADINGPALNSMWHVVKPLPSLFLYRGMSYPGGAPYSNLDSALHGKIYVSSYDGFNDPFDCKPSLSLAPFIVKNCELNGQSPDVLAATAFAIGETKELKLSEGFVAETAFCKEQLKRHRLDDWRLAIKELFSDDSYAPSTEEYRAILMGNPICDEKAFWAYWNKRKQDGTFRCFLRDHEFGVGFEGFCGLVSLIRFGMINEAYGTSDSGLAKFILGSERFDLMRQQGEQFRYFQAQLSSNYETIAKTFGVRCFSASKDSRLMWAHYADNYRGFCAEYDFNEIGDIRNEEGLPVPFGLFPVQYDSTRRSIVPTDVDIHSATDLNYCVFLSMLCKHAEWSYEREWRALFPFWKKSGSALVKPKAIYLGARSFENDPLRAGSFCQAFSQKGVRVYKMTLSEYNYSVSFCPIAPNGGGE